MEDLNGKMAYDCTAENQLTFKFLVKSKDKGASMITLDTHSCKHEISRNIIKSLDFKT